MLFSKLYRRITETFKKPNDRKTGYLKRSHQYSVLENRQLLAGITFDSMTGTIEIEGTNGNDSVEVLEVDSSTLSVDLTGFDQQLFAIEDVNLIRFRALEGDDQFTNNTQINATAFGHAGNDRFIGGGGHNRFQGGSGNDTLVGGDRNDALRGRDGNDMIEGGVRHDRLFGGNGNDEILGQHGRDVIRGEAGDDILTGGSQDDRIFGGDGNDQLLGNNGNDQLFGEDGDDLLTGHEGDDVLEGGVGDDTIDGGAGNDRLFGQAGSDSLDGKAGNDVLFGGVGPGDELTGGTGSDRILATRQDKTLDVGSTDAVIEFIDSGSLIDGGNWIDEQILTVNSAFDAISDRTNGSNTLLKDSTTSGVIRYVKRDDADPGNSRVNGVRTIQLQNWDTSNLLDITAAFNSVIHQTALTWSSVEEINAVFPGQGFRFTNFIAVSEWGEGTEVPAGFVASTDGEWFYREGTEFLNADGMINPHRDWATIWEFAFDSDPSVVDLNRLGLKLGRINQFFNAVSDA